jgi:hippurate hydrolase
MRSNGIRDGIGDMMVALRRDLHRHPETGWEVEQTAARIAQALATVGVDCRRIGGTGLVADLPAERPGDAIALRADMDALPITEGTGLAFRSVHPGVMHACGHDGHASALVGAAAILKRESLPVPVRLIFQPAEEIAEGALRLIQEGVLEGVSRIFGLHLDLGFGVGTIAVPPGPVNASTDEFTIRLRGTGGHAARPHEATDPIVAAGYLLAQLQTVVSRRVPSDEPAVLTVGTLRAGSAANVLAEAAEITGTLRATSNATRALLIASVQDIADATAAAHGTPATVTLAAGTPPVVNHPGPTAIARTAAERVVDPDRVSTAPLHNMGGEDFGFYLERVEGCFVRIGAKIDDGQTRRAHAANFDFDERALEVGARYLAAVALAAGADQVLACA